MRNDIEAAMRIAWQGASCYFLQRLNFLNDVAWSAASELGCGVDLQADVLRDLSLCNQAIEAASKKRSAIQHTSSPGASNVTPSAYNGDLSANASDASNDFLEFKERRVHRWHFLFDETAGLNWKRTIHDLFLLELFAV